MNSTMFNDFMFSDTIKIFSGYKEIKYLIIYCRVYLYVSGCVLLGNVTLESRTP